MKKPLTLNQIDEQLRKAQKICDQRVQSLNILRSKLITDVPFTTEEIFEICQTLHEETTSYQGEGEVRRGISVVRKKVLEKAILKLSGKDINCVAGN